MSMETIKTECQAELNVVENADQLAAFWAKYLGKGGEVHLYGVLHRRRGIHVGTDPRYPDPQGAGRRGCPGLI